MKLINYIVFTIRLIDSTGLNYIFIQMIEKKWSEVWISKKIIYILKTWCGNKTFFFDSNRNGDFEELKIRRKRG